MKLPFTKKELKKWHVALILLALFIGGTFVYINFILVQNVFDHIYYANAYPNNTGKLYPFKLGIKEKSNPQIRYNGGGGGLWGNPYVHSAYYYTEYINSPYKLPNEKLWIDIQSPLGPYINETYDLATYGAFHIYYSTEIIRNSDQPHKDVFIIVYYYDVENKSLKERMEYYRVFGTIVDGVFETDSSKGSIDYNTDEEKEQFLRHFGLTMDDVYVLREWVLYDKVLADWFTHNKFNTRFSPDNLGKFELQQSKTYFDR